MPSELREPLLVTIPEKGEEEKTENQIKSDLAELKISVQKTLERANSMEKSPPPGSPKGAVHATKMGTMKTEPMTFWGWSVANVRRCVFMIILVHNVVYTLLIRYTRARTDIPLYLPSEAVFYTEIMKLVTCTFLVAYEEKGMENALSLIWNKVLLHPSDTLRVGLPAFLYTMQTNLFYLGATHLEAATFMIVSQLKLFTTAFFAVILMGKRLSLIQMFAMLMLFGGVTLVQMPADTVNGKICKPLNITTLCPANSTKSNAMSTAKSKYAKVEHPWIGFFAVAAASTLSGFAGIYLEIILKGHAPVGLWVRNIQLATCAAPIALATMLLKDWRKLMVTGLLHGFDFAVFMMVIWYGLGGLAVALTIKYADNILKDFATSCAIVFSTAGSVYIFGFVITPYFLLGAGLVMCALFVYSNKLSQPATAYYARTAR